MKQRRLSQCTRHEEDSEPSHVTPRRQKTSLQKEETSTLEKEVEVAEKVV